MIVPVRQVAVSPSGYFQSENDNSKSFDPVDVSCLSALALTTPKSKTKVYPFKKSYLPSRMIELIKKLLSFVIFYCKGKCHMNSLCISTFTLLQAVVNILSLHNLLSRTRGKIIYQRLILEFVLWNQNFKYWLIVGSRGPVKRKIPTFFQFSSKMVSMCFFLSCIIINKNALPLIKP